MSYTKQHTKLFTAMIAVLACLVLTGWLGWRFAAVAAANPGKNMGTKTVNIDHQYSLDAVAITKVTVAGEQIQPGVATAAREDKPGTPFQADEDWLKNMSISLKNRTDKAIVCVQVQLFFPDTGNGVTPQGRISPTVMVYSITVGQRPEWSTYLSDGSKLAPDPTKRPLLLAPGQTLVIPVADYIDEIQSMVEEKLPLSQVTRVNIRRFRFYFADGMRWEDVGYAIPDPDRPGYYTKLARNYFPGHPVQD
jgi:hypothetical protein